MSIGADSHTEEEILSRFVQAVEGSKDVSHETSKIIVDCLIRTTLSTNSSRKYLANELIEATLDETE